MAIDFMAYFNGGYQLTSPGMILPLSVLGIKVLNIKKRRIITTMDFGSFMQPQGFRAGLGILESQSCKFTFFL